MERLESLYSNKFTDILCDGMCRHEEDTLEHAKRCRFLESKWKDGTCGNPRELAKFLRVLNNNEGDSKWKKPLW